MTNRHAWLPSYWCDTKPNDWLVSVMIYVAILLGGYGVWLAVKALKHGWAPRVNRLVALGIGTTAAITLVPPMASGDVLIYAAYGRIMSLGGNPYTTAPADTIRLGYDPVIAATERPWQGAKSVYGPIATWIQWFASWVGGDSMQLTVWMLQLSVAISLIVTGLLLLKLVGPNLPNQRRVVMLGMANPLMLWTVLAGAHNDAIAVMFAVIALVLFRTTRVLGRDHARRGRLYEAVDRPGRRRDALVAARGSPARDLSSASAARSRWAVCTPSSACRRSSRRGRRRPSSRPVRRTRCS